VQPGGAGTLRRRKKVCTQSALGRICTAADRQKRTSSLKGKGKKTEGAQLRNSLQNSELENHRGGITKAAKEALENRDSIKRKMPGLLQNWRV